MTAITFDTLAYTQRLEKSGFTREQAEAVAKANAEALRDIAATQELATKKDLAETKADLQRQISETKHELLKWLIGMMTAQTALLVGIIAYTR